MKDPRAYLEEIQQNLAKLQAQGQVTPNENALFGMVDGLAGLVLVTLERVTALEQRLGVRPARSRRVTGTESVVAPATAPPDADSGNAHRMDRPM